MPAVPSETTTSVPASAAIAMARPRPARPPASLVTQRLTGRATSCRKTRSTPRTTSVGPTSKRSEDAPRISPTKRTTRATSSAGVGTRPPMRFTVPELAHQAIEAVRIVEQRAWVVGERAERGSDQRPEGGTQVGQERREGPMGIEKKTGRSGKPAALELVGHAAGGAIGHVTGTEA